MESDNHSTRSIKERLRTKIQKLQRKKTNENSKYLCSYYQTHALEEDKLDSLAWDSFSSAKWFVEMKHNEQLEQKYNKNFNFEHYLNNLLKHFIT